MISKENATIIRALNNYGRVPEQYELLDEIERLQQELQRKDNIINELKKMLEENKLNIAQALNFYNGKSYNGAIIDILDKIKELENGNK